MSPDKDVLVVDDDEDLREMIGVILDAHGYRTRTAANGADALRQIEEGPTPALALVDLRMPSMNGVEFLHALQARGRSTIPVVVITGDLGGTAEAIAAGARDYLTKPVDMATLLAAVRQHAG